MHPYQFVPHADYIGYSGTSLQTSLGPSGRPTRALRVAGSNKLAFLVSQMRSDGKNATVWVADFHPPTGSPWREGDFIAVGAMVEEVETHTNAQHPFGFFAHKGTFGVNLINCTPLVDGTAHPRHPDSWYLVNSGAVRVAVLVVPGHGCVCVRVRGRAKALEREAVKREVARQASRKEEPSQLCEEAQRMSAEERAARAEECNDRGNDAYRAQNWAEAERHYTTGLSFDSGIAKLWCNRAYVRGKQGNHTGALDDAQRALAIESQYVRALLRRGQARVALGLHTAAMGDFKEALKLTPNDTALKWEVDNLTQLVRRQEEVSLPMDTKGMPCGLLADLGGVVGARAEIVGLASVTDGSAVTWERLDQLFPPSW